MCPRLGIEPVNLWFTGRSSIHWAAPTRAVLFFKKKKHFLFPLFSYIKLCGGHSWSLSPLHRNSVMGLYKMARESLIGRHGRHSLFPEVGGEIAVGLSYSISGALVKLPRQLLHGHNLQSVILRDTSMKKSMIWDSLMGWRRDRSLPGTWSSSPWPGSPAWGQGYTLCPWLYELCGLSPQPWPGPWLWARPWMPLPNPSWKLLQPPILGPLRPAGPPAAPTSFTIWRFLGKEATLCAFQSILNGEPCSLPSPLPLFN